METYKIETEGYRKLAKYHDVREGGILRILLEENEWEVALTKVNGHIYAFRDVCPHQAFPLSVGHMDGCSIICTAHHWRFNVKTGAAENPPIHKKLETYPVIVEDGDIWVAVKIW